MQPSISERVKAYITSVEKALELIKPDELDTSAHKVYELARSYLSDSKYYYEKGDYETALACIAYAEGLLDALNHMGIVHIDWKPYTAYLKRPRVLVAGAFEIIHPGHLYLFKKAWELGEVYVIVARDKNFEKFKKRKPAVPEEQRRTVVESIKYVTKAVLGDEKDIYRPIVELKPDIILLGPDQGINEDKLINELSKRGLNNVKVLRLKQRIGNYSVSRIIEKIIELSKSSIT
ncbi:MAG: DUF357 domain-containing protein [Thermoprotei archaeon]